MTTSTASANLKPRQDRSVHAESMDIAPALSDSLLNGITISLVEAPWWLAMLALVFSGALSSYMDQAALFFIAGAVLSMTIVSFFSSWKGAIWLPQDVPTTLLVIITAEIVAELATEVPEDTLFVTVLITIALASLVTGIFMCGLGTFRLGGLVRHIPFPVLAGFLAGTGWLLLLGGIDSSLAESVGGDLFDMQTIKHWAPCVVLAVLMYGLGLRIKNALLLPLMMLTATLFFFAVALYLDKPVAALNAGGWLFNAAHATAQQSNGEILQQLQGVQWLAILGHLDALITLALASSIAMLMNNSGFELSVKGRFDHNKDLQVTGMANVLASLVGGWPGYMSPAWSSINARQGRQLPLTGLIVALLTGILLWYATQLLSFVPRFVIGSAIAYVGVSFLYEWLILPLMRLPLHEGLILLSIVLVAALFGLLVAVGLGLVISVLQFAIRSKVYQGA